LALCASLRRLQKGQGTRLPPSSANPSLGRHAFAFSARAFDRYFKVSNRAEGKSPATIRWYDQNIALFVRFLNDTGRCPEPLSRGTGSATSACQHERWQSRQ
jgi:hypothetical protein